MKILILFHFSPNDLFLDHLYTHLRSPSILAAGSNSNQTQNSTLVKENKDVCFNLHIVFRYIKIG
jgi:hypothetical protein